MKIAYDSNLIAYAEGVVRVPGDLAKAALAERIKIEVERTVEVLLPAQVLGEVYNVFLKRGRFEPREAARRVGEYRDGYTILPTTPEAFIDALHLAAEHQFSIWDAIIVTVAADAGCVLLLSEDMQDGFVHRGMTIANPFAPVLDARLASLLTP